MTFRRAGALTLLVAITTLSVAAVSTARPPTSPTTLDPGAFRPLVLTDAPAGQATPWPSFELAVPEGPRSIGDFTEPDRAFGSRADPNQPTRAQSLLKPTPTPKPRPQAQGGGGNASRRGAATWYCQPGVSACHYEHSGGMYAAAGAELRVGDWRGRTVRVCAGGSCVRVTLIDWCACGGNRIIDLYSDAFRRLAPLSAGTIRVRVSW